MTPIQPLNFYVLENNYDNSPCLEEMLKFFYIPQQDHPPHRPQNRQIVLEEYRHKLTLTFVCFRK